MPHRVGGPVPTESRSGREKQKYGPDGERLVAGSIPLRFKPGVQGPEGVEVLLISSRRGKGHVFPKGGWETDESCSEAALRETVEEAGVRGELEEPLVGAFPFHSGKAERAGGGHRGRCIAYLFALHVTEELSTWPEAGQRQREWCSLQEACGRCRYDWMREALVAWMQRKGWGAAAAACRACGEAAAAARAAETAALEAQQLQQPQQPSTPQEQQTQAQMQAQAAPQQQQQQQQAACAAVMATGALPAEAAATAPPVDLLAPAAIRT